MVLPPYQISWKSNKRLKSYYWGHTDRETDWWFDKHTFILESGLRTKGLTTDFDYRRVLKGKRTGNVMIAEAHSDLGSRVAQSVQCLTTDWAMGRSRFDSLQGWKDFCSCLCVQTGSEAHPASCTMGTGVIFPGVKLCPGVTMTAHPYLVPRSRMSRSYISCPLKRLHGV
jgi:hypothetical protein